METATRTSFWIVSLTLTLLECGSVQTKPASTRWILESPFSLLRQTASSSRDSRVQDTQLAGGWRYLMREREESLVEHPRARREVILLE